MVTDGSLPLLMEVFGLVMIRTLLTCSLIAIAYTVFRNDIQQPATLVEIKPQTFIENKIKKSVTSDVNKNTSYIVTLKKSLVNLSDEIDTVEKKLLTNPDQLGLRSMHKQLVKQKKIYLDHLKYYSK